MEMTAEATIAISVLLGSASLGIITFGVRWIIRVGKNM